MAGAMRLTWRRTTATSSVPRSRAGLWQTTQTSKEVHTAQSLPPRDAHQEGLSGFAGSRGLLCCIKSLFFQGMPAEHI